MDESEVLFNFAVDQSISSRRRGLSDYQAGPLRLIAPRGSIEGAGNINLTGDATFSGAVSAGTLSVGGRAVQAGAWSPYSPVVTQSVSCAMEPGTARYIRLGKTIHVQYTARKSSAGTGTANQPVRVGLPVAAASTFDNAPCGTGYIYDGSAALFYVGVTAFWSTTEVGFFMGGAIGGGVWLGSANFVDGLAFPDWIRFSCTYEAAT